MHRTPAGRRPAEASLNGRGWVVEPEVEARWLGELVPEPVPVRVSLARGDERAAVQLALRQGVTDASRLTNLVFHGRHPERGGRSIGRDEQTLAREWVDIRDHVVRPLLASASAPTAAPVPAGAPPAAPGAFRPVPVESPGGARVREKRDPAPSDVVTVRGVNGPVPLHRLAAEAWAAMVSAARADGIAQPLLLPVSGYRSSAHQNRLWQHALARYGSAEEARKWVAPPGGSAHQSGRAIDMYLGARNDSSNVPKLRRTPAYQWLVANARRFGFYPYEREPWHWEYNPPAAGTALELELDLETDRIPSSGLEWPGASADQLAFMRAVYERHVERQKAAGGTFTGDLPKSQLETIEGRHEARKDAARAARALLAEARAALAAEGLASRVHIGIVSAYRSAGLQFQIWQGKGRQGGFPYYYRQLLKKGRLRPGDYGPQAVDVTAREIAQWVAAPGYSNHQDGLAIDFAIGEVGRGLGKIGPRAWLYRWLTANARRFGFHPYAKEAWHWTYRPGTEGEVWSGEVGAAGIRAGRLEVATAPVLARHRGKAPAIVLRWNDMPSAPAEIDVVVNLHGFSRPWLTLPRDIEPTSGLDLAPVDGAAGRGRSRPTLTILPRAHYTGVQQKGGPLYVYTFPALDGTDGRRDGITRLIQFSLEQFAAAVGGTAPRVGRLILTAHSGGGQPLLRILRFLDPHEVHVYDALYWDANPLAAWARKHIAQDRSALTSAGSSARDYMSTRGGAMRVFYRGPTRGNSRKLRDAIAAQLGGGIENWYRVEASPLGHWQIPRTYGWRVLADAAADVPRATREQASQRELELEYEGVWPLVKTPQALAAFVLGERDENRLTNIVFFARHPERGGRPIARGETQLAQEWTRIRDEIVRPALRGGAAAPPPTPAGAGAPGTAQFTRRTPSKQRWAALLPLLDRYRGDIPLEFLLGWIAVESDGRVDVVTSLDERGFFQIHPDESHDRHFDHPRLTSDPDYSVQAGIQNIRYYADLARRRFPSIPVGSELFWRVVKLQHALGSPLTKRLLDGMRASNVPLTWEAIKQWEVTHGPQLHRLLRVEPLGRFGRNVDGVFTRGRELARSLGR
jgi:LAS superfamily LD-carboxypeptidase LdcB